LEQVAWKSIIIAGWPVLSVLFIASIITFAVIFERWKVFKTVNRDNNPFIESLRKNGDTNKIISWCKSSKQPLAAITVDVFEAPANRADKERVLERAIQVEVQTLEKHVAVLGTIASVAPFVGLLGTVLGIISAFRAVSMTSSGGASMVALGIAEALVGTAAGLIVAIPALLAYNYFAHGTRHLIQSWEIAGDEIIDLALELK